MRRINFIDIRDVTLAEKRVFPYGRYPTWRIDVVLYCLDNISYRGNIVGWHSLISDKTRSLRVKNIEVLGEPLEVLIKESRLITPSSRRKSLYYDD